MQYGIYTRRNPPRSHEMGSIQRSPSEIGRSAVASTTEINPGEREPNQQFATKTDYRTHIESAVPGEDDDYLTISISRDNTDADERIDVRLKIPPEVAEVLSAEQNASPLELEYPSDNKDGARIVKLRNAHQALYDLMCGLQQTIHDLRKLPVASAERDDEFEELAEQLRRIRVAATLQRFDSFRRMGNCNTAIFRSWRGIKGALIVPAPGEVYQLGGLKSVILLPLDAYRINN